MDEIDQLTSITVDITFTNEELNPITPLSTEYSILDFFSDEFVLSPIEINPDDSTYTLKINSEYNDLLDENNPFEIRIITFKYEHEPERFKTKEIRYKIWNLAAIPAVPEGD